MPEVVNFDEDYGPRTTFKLRGRQPDWIEAIEQDMQTHNRLLVVAPGGVGKTGVMGVLAARFWARGIRTLVLENRDRLTEQTAERMRNETGLDVDVEKGDKRASPFAPIVVACVQSLSKISRLTGFADSHFGLVVADECFPSNVLVDGVPISQIKVGDLISSYNHEKQCIELRKVSATSVSIPSSLVELNLSSGRSIVCTAGHPFFTKGGYKRAIDLSNGVEVAARRNGVLEMRDENTALSCRCEIKDNEAPLREVQKRGSHGEADHKRSPLQTVREDCQVFWMRQINFEPSGNNLQSGLLLNRMPRHMGESESEDTNCIIGGREKKRIPQNAREQPHEQSGDTREDEGVHEGENVSEPRGKWIPDGSTGCIGRGARGRPDGICHRDGRRQGKIPVSTNVLQGGYSHPGIEAGNRGGWQDTQNEEMEILRPEKDGDIEFFRVDSIKILERRSDSGYAEVCPDGCVYNLEVEGNHNYFADGFLVHNCHLALSPTWLRIINRHHYGDAALASDWAKPADGTYVPKAYVVGFTASPDLGDRRNLGEIFHKQSVNYSYLEAIEEGWLVGIREVNVPVHVDTRRFRVKKTAEGSAFSVADQNTAYTPDVIEKLALQYVKYASDKKGMIFVPSVEIARQMSAVLCAKGLRSIFVSGECIDKNEKTDAFAADGPGSVLVNCTIYTFGVDFPDVDCIAPFGAIISKVKYIQSVYRGTRVLPGIVHNGMTADERVAAIAASAKPHLLLLSPFFISDKISICEPFDLFGIKPETKKKVKGITDFTNPGKIRDYIKALEKAADKHAHKQARTIDPVKFALNIGDGALANYVPGTSAEAAPPATEELDILLAAGIDTSAIKSSGQAQMLISRHRERDRLGLATPKQLNFLRQLTKTDEHGRKVPLYNEDWIVTIRKNQAGALMGRQAEKWHR